MPRRPLRLVVPMIAASVLLTVFVVHQRNVRRARRWVAPTTVVANEAPAPIAAATPTATPEPGREVEKGLQARYSLSLEHHAAMGDKTLASVEVRGEWTLTQLTDGRTLAQLAAQKISVTGDAAPTPEDVAKPFVLIAQNGVLDRVAFAPGTSDRAKQLLSSIAALVQLTVRDEDSWNVEEQDLSGTYQAKYTSDGTDIVRTRGQYLAMRDASGLGDHPGRNLISKENSRFTFDDQGLASETVKLSQTAHLTKGMAAVQMGAQATLTRLEMTRVALTAGPDYTPEPIASHYDRAAHNRKRLEERVNGASPATLVRDAVSAGAIDPKAPNAHHARFDAMDRMAAMIQLDPRTAAVFADAIRVHRDDARFVDLASGALAGAGSPTATNALVSVLDEPLPDDSRLQVIGSLGMSRAPTPESVAALTSALDENQGLQAALALGNEAKTLGDKDSSAQQAISTLEDRYSNTSDQENERAYLLALANTGSRSVLPMLEQVIRGSDFGLAEIATFGLRLIPGDDVDDLLNGLIASGSPLTVDAIRAVGYRSPALWTARLEAYLVQYQGQQQVVDTIKGILSRWTPPPAADNGGTPGDAQGMPG